MAPFLDRLERLDGDSIVAIADAVRSSSETVDGEVLWWRSTVVVQNLLRYQRRCRDASRASRAAVRSVQAAARRAGLADEESTNVTLVARAAGDAASAMVADAPGEALQAFLNPFGLTAELPSGSMRLRVVPAITVG